jgi:hypothetical protein
MKAKVKISMNKQYWIEGVVVGFNPITERFLIASPQDGRLLAYNFISDLDEEIISESELEQIKKEQKEIAVQSLSNLRSKFSV